MLLYEVTEYRRAGGGGGGVTAGRRADANRPRGVFCRALMLLLDSDYQKMQLVGRRLLHCLLLIILTL